MKIAIDGFQLHSGYTGVGRYLYNLLKHIVKKNSEISFTVFLNSENSLKFIHPSIDYRVISPGKKNFIWQNFYLHRELKKGNFSFLWSPNYYSPFFFKKKSVLTVHDISWRFLKNDYSFSNRLRREILLKNSLKNSEHIFTISDFSKKEICSNYRFDISKISSIPLGIDDSFKPASNTEILSFKKKYGLEDKKVIGFLGSMFPRRNIDKLIDSFKILQSERNDLFLFLIGKNYDGNIKIGSDNKGIIVKERLKEDEISLFYSSLELFVYISDYEGFGFPPLEALACGTISLLMDKPALNEIFEYIAVFTNSKNPNDIANKIKSILSDKRKYKYKILKNFKKKRKYFSWNRVADEYIKIFKSV